MKYNVVIVAAGSGSRMGLGYNKIYATLPDGRTILETTIATFLNDADCTEIVVVSDPCEFRKRFGCKFNGKVVLCKGGKTRQESVWNGLRAVMSEYVMIHDGARPYIKQSSLDALKQAMEHEKAAILTVPCKNTIKKVKDGYIESTINREQLVAAQTPQMFETKMLIECLTYAIKLGFTGTDDASAVEKFGKVKIKAVEGDYANIKITTADDLKK